LGQRGDLLEGLLQQLGHDTNLPDGSHLRNAARWNAPWAAGTENPQTLKSGSALPHCDS
jgi:hypothetical protein